MYEIKISPTHMVSIKAIVIMTFLLLRVSFGRFDERYRSVGREQFLVLFPTSSCHNESTVVIEDEGMMKCP